MANKTALQILTEARDLISDKRHHCKGWLAQTGEGEKVYYDDPRAVQFCAIYA